MFNQIENNKIDNDYIPYSLEDENCVEVVDDNIAMQIDNSVGLETILLRINKDVIDNLTIIAKENGLNDYTVLIRKILKQYAEENIKSFDLTKD